MRISSVVDHVLVSHSLFDFRTLSVDVQGFYQNLKDGWRYESMRVLTQYYQCASVL